jgi:catechol 2,3-dioxygenase-like lactoylglutathione lyase family enzyme
LCDCEGGGHGHAVPYRRTQFADPGATGIKVGGSHEYCAEIGGSGPALIAVRNVRASSRWYAELLGADPLAEHKHRDVRSDFLPRPADSATPCLGRRESPKLGQANAAPAGRGVLLWFHAEDFQAAVERARALPSEIVEEPHVNPAPQHREMWLRDPDGYVVVIASPDGGVGAGVKGSARQKTGEAEKGFVGWYRRKGSPATEKRSFAWLRMTTRRDLGALKHAPTKRIGRAKFNACWIFWNAESRCVWTLSTVICAWV